MSENNQHLYGSIMKSILIASIVNILFITTSFAYAPTLESLLRNGENPEIDEMTVLANIRIKSTKINERDTEVSSNQALKYLIYNQNPSAPTLVQLEYAANSFKSENLYRIRTFQFNNIDRITKNAEQIEQRLFYAVLAHLLRNDGSFIIDLLKSQGFPIKENNELVNVQKQRLLASYRYYLRKVKEGDTTVANPLKPEDSDAREKVEQIFNAPYILEDGLVKRHKNGDHFNWIVNTENLYISFDHDHKLEELSFETSAGKFSVTLGRSIIQGAGMEFPEEVVFKTPNNNEFKMELVSLKKFSDTPARQSKRMEEYQEDMRKNNISTTQVGVQLTL